MSRITSPPVSFVKNSSLLVRLRLIAEELAPRLAAHDDDECFALAVQLLGIIRKLRKAEREANPEPDEAVR